MDTLWLDTESMAHRSFDFKALVSLIISVKLRREASWITVVLYAERHGRLVSLIQDSPLNWCEIWVASFQTGVDQDFVEVRSHSIADSVVASDTKYAIVKALDQEMLGKIASVNKVGPEVFDGATFDILDDDCLSCRVYLLTEVRAHYASRGRDFSLWLILCNGEVIDDATSDLGVHVALSWLGSHVLFQAVTTMEELADVAADVVLQDEATTWVLVYELANIKNELVKNNKLASIDNSLLKLLDRHRGLRCDQVDLLAKLALMECLSDDQAQEE